MKFPVVADIATVNVVSLKDDDTLFRAIELMLDNEHRNIVIEGKGIYYILNVLDVIKLKNQNTDLQIKLEKLDLQKIPTVEKHVNVLDTLDTIATSSFICVVNMDNSLYGLVSHSDITANIDPETLMENYRLKDIFKIGRKSKEINQNDLLSSVFRDMADGSYDNVVILDEKKPIGILTTKDVMRLIRSKSDLNMPIKMYMSSPVDTVNVSSSIKYALEYVKEKRYKRIVVVNEDGTFAGIINQSELISLTYSKWANLMKKYQSELSEINSMLEKKNKEYEYMASTDSLTGLYNRYKFSELFLSSYKSMIQRDNKMSLIMLDIDFFKKVNDTYGHNVGDAVLIQVSHVMLKILRNVDIVARWGGEEFIMLLPTANIDNAYTLAQKIRTSIENQEIDIVGKITVSIGVSEVMEGDSMEEAIKKADDTLYLAKNSGRNCVKTDKEL